MKFVCCCSSIVKDTTGKTRRTQNKIRYKREMKLMKNEEEKKAKKVIYFYSHLSVFYIIVSSATGQAKSCEN